MQDEPKRALQCLQDVRSGAFGGLVPAHLHTQVWKVSRCVGASRTPLGIDFIGKLENAEQDWDVIQDRLGLSPKLKLPVVHSSNAGKERLIVKQTIDFKAAEMKPLVEKVCEYYRQDFECFGYDDSVCD